MRTIVMPQDCYPLLWPVGVPRTKSPSHAAFKRGATYSAAVREVREELQRLNARTLIVSSNLAGDGVRNRDHGAAAYWIMSEAVHRFYLAI